MDITDDSNKTLPSHCLKPTWFWGGELGPVLTSFLEEICCCCATHVGGSLHRTGFSVAKHVHGEEQEREGTEPG